MRHQPVSHRFLMAVAIVLACAAAVTACGSGGGSGSGSSAPASAPASSAPASSAAAPSSSAPASSSGAAAQIKKNWEAFFSAKTPTSTRVSLLQNGQKFASILKAQASSPLASSASASVSSVKVESPTQAKIIYSVLVGGTPALKNQPGIAVKQGGTWKVGDQSFCSLLTMENNGKAPSICAGATG